MYLCYSKQVFECKSFSFKEQSVLNISLFIYFATLHKMTTPINDKLNEYSISGTQMIIPIDFNAGNVEFVSVKVDIKFLNQIPIDIAFTNQHTLDNFPDTIEFKTLTRDSANSFDINAREYRLPILILRTSNPDHTTNILLNYDVYPASAENFTQATTATAATDDTQKKWNDYIYLIIAVFVILFVIIFVLKLTKNK